MVDGTRRKKSPSTTLSARGPRPREGGPRRRVAGPRQYAPGPLRRPARLRRIVLGTATRCAGTRQACRGVAGHTRRSASLDEVTGDASRGGPQERVIGTAALPHRCGASNQPDPRNERADLHTRCVNQRTSWLEWHHRMPEPAHLIPGSAARIKGTTRSIRAVR